MEKYSRISKTEEKEIICEFLIQLFQVYRDLYFTYMEINPLVVKDGKIFILDLAAKIDQVLTYYNVYNV